MSKFFGDPITVRFRDGELRKVFKFLQKDPERFANRSHFVRCAVMKFIRDEEDDGKA